MKQKNCYGEQRKRECPKTDKAEAQTFAFLTTIYGYGSSYAQDP